MKLNNKYTKGLYLIAKTVFVLFAIVILASVVTQSISALFGVTGIMVDMVGTQIALLAFGMYLIDFDMKYLIDKLKGKLKIKTFLQAGKLILLIFAINITIGTLSGPITSDTTTDVMLSGNMLFQILAVVILAPLVEEFTFRLGLKRKLVDKGNLSNLSFIILSGLIFGLLHWQPGSSGLIIVGLTASIGIVNAISYIKTDNILVPAIGHVAYNAIILLLASMV